MLRSTRDALNAWPRPDLEAYRGSSQAATKYSREFNEHAMSEIQGPPWFAPRSRVAAWTRLELGQIVEVEEAVRGERGHVAGELEAERPVPGALREGEWMGRRRAAGEGHAPQHGPPPAELAKGAGSLRPSPLGVEFALSQRLLTGRPDASSKVVDLEGFSRRRVVRPRRRSDSSAPALPAARVTYSAAIERIRVNWRS
jgi:hypothetical protein